MEKCNKCGAIFDGKCDFDSCPYYPSDGSLAPDVEDYKELVDELLLKIENLEQDIKDSDTFDIRTLIINAMLENDELCDKIPLRYKEDGSTKIIAYESKEKLSYFDYSRKYSGYMKFITKITFEGENAIGFDFILQHGAYEIVKLEVNKNKPDGQKYLLKMD